MMRLATPDARPAMDVLESEHGFTVRVEVPGIAPEKLDVQVDGDLLTIRGEMDQPADGERYHYRERRAGSFKRTLRLADTLDTQAIQATYQNGLLTLDLPKTPKIEPKRIEVKIQ
ncbi:MAG TPA: Hsp20/alpha crystallin family protein [Phototrophicaceae bacterium]|nr:Hsp20/alpha crystallin family protein [Phototrophicaceae bacterium]HEX3054215.1 Hsp20/alpha crystallin family protein [Aggregatilineaceae bacterium]